MKNALRLGATVAAATLVGLSDNTTAAEYGYTTTEAIVEIVMPVLDRLDVTQKQLDATRAQVAELVKRLEITETTCEDAASEDGCPIGCEPSRLEGHHTIF